MTESPNSGLDALIGPPNHTDPQADALDALIEQWRKLIDYYEARQARAEGTAAAALTAVLALAALTATAAETSAGVDETYAWIVVGVLAFGSAAALGVRSVAGLRAINLPAPISRLRRPHDPLLSTGSRMFRSAVDELRMFELNTKMDPIEVRWRILMVCVARADDAHEAAKRKDRWVALTSFALAVSVALTAVLAVQLLAG